MSLYQHHILPRLTDWVMGQAVLSDFRSRVVGGARGRVLEIGIGSGRNLPFYGGAATEVVGVDSSPELLALARRAAAVTPHPVKLMEQTAEQLPFSDSSFDTAVVTWSLCSIPDPVAALREARRVLRPGGQLRFVEHGLAPDPGVRRWQHRLTPVWSRCAGGCHLDRKMDDLIHAAGFHITDLKAGYVPGIRLLGFMYEGCARDRSG
ncbi:methyltransferase domain-containing protein [Azospirillum formosense]|uniref:Methyltransferase domain-containing protein n=1 Tax=Azospirillum formosense TaxID=861533 RepID=A0ABX2KW67_9PROT|nr:class I SAM-dependent methyltransferase [Azospirillum formosense]MBY3755498.1 class I SAM-dependent methyltransferase [Azospirillum formosense]NUB19878.1 methyltransferase domain-containing protein [Azospirillum formosense]